MLKHMFLYLFNLALKLWPGSTRGIGGGIVWDESICFPPSTEKSSMNSGKVGGVSGLSCKQHLQALKQTKTKRHHSRDDKRISQFFILILTCIYLCLWPLGRKGLHHVLQILHWAAYGGVSVGTTRPGVMEPLGTQNSPWCDNGVPCVDTVIILKRLLGKELQERTQKNFQPY